MNDKRVVITGMGAITPLGNDVPAYWGAIVDGRCGITKITSFDPSAHASQIAGEVKGFDPSSSIKPKDARRMDRFVQFAVVATEEARKNASLDMGAEDPDRVGVLIGSGIGGLLIIERQHSVLLEKGPTKVSPFLIPMLITNMASGQVSIRLGAKGPNLCIATACATATHSIGEAARIIASGDADVMVAGGTESATTPLGLAGFCALKALSTRNDAPEKSSRPFDAERDGFIMSEGAGIVILEELEHAKKRGAVILAELAGYGLTGDAHHMTAPAPEGAGAAQCMRRALKSAGLNPEDIGYINAHGTSTKLNDKFETAAIRTVFGQHADNIPVSSTKSMIGHLLGAAGGVELIAAVLALEKGVIPPTINYENPDPECDLDYVPNAARELQVNAALSNSFGFGGHNATLLVKKFAG